MDHGSNAEQLAEVNETLTEILKQLKGINVGLDELRDEVGDVKRQQHTLELNLSSIQEAYRSVLLQINGIDTRCSNRAERIRTFLESVECVGTPTRKTPSREVPSLTVLAAQGTLSAAADPDPEQT